MSDSISVNITEIEETITVNITEAKDAYQLAVDGGFGGTRSEWLASLEGEDADATAAEAAIAAHAARVDNPHVVTASQAGADPVGSAATAQSAAQTYADGAADTAAASAQAAAVADAAADATTKANAAQAHAIQRANHTGTQPLATISDAGTMAAQNAGGVTAAVTLLSTLSVQSLTFQSNAIVGNPDIAGTLRNRGKTRLGGSAGVPSAASAHVECRGEIELWQVAAGGTPAADSSRIYTKDVAGTAEGFWMDEAGNETQQTPHSTTAPEWMQTGAITGPEPIGFTAQHYTGICTYTHRETGASHRETFDEHNSRLGLTGARALVVLDWDAVQATHVTTREKEIEEAQEQLAEWKANESLEKGEAPSIPAPYTPKPRPEWARAVTRVELDQIEAPARAKKASQGEAFAALRSGLATTLGIEISTPADLTGRIGEIIPAARSKRDTTPDTKGRLQELEKQVELLTQFVVMLSRA